MKIRTKLILANLFIVLFLLGSVTYALTKRSSDLVHEHIVQNATLSLSQIGQNLDNRLASYEDVANTLFLNPSLNLILDQRYADQLEAYEVYSEQFQPFLSAIQSTRDVMKVDVYTDNPSFFFSNVQLIDNGIRNSDWYTEVMSNNTGGYWTHPYLTFPKKEPVVSFRKRLNNVNRDSPSVVSLEIRLKNLAQLVDLESKNKRVIFALSDGTVLIDSDKENAVGNVSELPFGGQVMSGMDGSFNQTLNKESYQILFQTLNSRNIVKGMKVIAFVPTEELSAKLLQLRSLALLLFALALAVSVLLISVMSVSLTRRLSDLAVKMKRLNRDKFDSFVDVKGSDEVAQLGEMFNLMVRRLRELIGEVYQSELDRRENALRTKEVELYALQTQINPHFLFNTLNMIRGKLLIAGDRDNAKVIGLLAKSFRMMLKKGGPTIRLSEELDFISSYLQIQQYRFGDKFTYEIDVPEEEMDALVPKLCIQPIVENAISHGIELSPKPSNIRISGQRRGKELLLIIRDNGLGIAAERLADIQSRLRSDDSLTGDAHIGLQNVQHRLKHLFGESYGLEITSEDGAWTEVTMSIPRDGQEEAPDVRRVNRG
ncbi:MULTISPECIES: sensor histidine kinase [unclassified Paenibacillus]|uniref:sensor histidine kinase n=1 Tax=unclassified Paenibacillus TaxID=185978 RepID=UPI0010F174FF|nr:MULTISPECIES: sensor histidine kinase [unclassified Paenibacillus]NIK71223.1 sensor histidine kinase YesM [Paenibacillus sp. BK720]TCM97057.1 histidine kinase/DNA gyrase B/HSP90-like ATPase [Paenibacillus sp. BK033]